MALADEIAALPISITEGNPGHVAHSEVLHQAVQAHQARLGAAEGELVTKLDEAEVDARVILAVHGALNTLGANAVMRRYERPIRMASFADSRAEGVTPDYLTEGILSWADTFPIRMAGQMRAELGLPAGGRGWVPLTLTDASTAYRFSVASFVAGASDPVVGDTGVPGSQYMTEAKTIRVPLSAGCTSVKVLSAPTGPAAGYGVLLTGQSGATNGTGEGYDGNSAVGVSNLVGPGTHVDITSAGGGLFALGLMEYVGDETSGVQVANFAVSGIDSVDMAAHVAKPTMTALLDWLAPDVSIVALGANDIIHTITPAQSTTALSAILTSSGGVKVSATAVPAGAATTAWDDLNNAIRTMSGVTCADIASTVTGSTDASGDGLFLSDDTHLTLSGNIGFADVLRATLLGP